MKQYSQNLVPSKNMYAYGLPVNYLEKISMLQVSNENLYCYKKSSWKSETLDCKDNIFIQYFIIFTKICEVCGQPLSNGSL